MSTFKITIVPSPDDPTKLQVRCTCGWFLTVDSEREAADWKASHQRWHAEQDDPRTRPSSDGWTGD